MREASRVLVVEDDEGIASGICDVLAHEGCKGMWVTGETAAETAARWNPTVVLLDLIMQPVDGYMVAEQLRANEQTAGVPIVVMTAAARPYQAAERMAAKGILIKPFDIDELLTVVREAQRGADQWSETRRQSG